VLATTAKVARCIGSQGHPDVESPCGPIRRDRRRTGPISPGSRDRRGGTDEPGPCSTTAWPARHDGRRPVRRACRQRPELPCGETHRPSGDARRLCRPAPAGDRFGRSRTGPALSKESSCTGVEVQADSRGAIPCRRAVVAAGGKASDSQGEQPASHFAEAWIPQFGCIVFEGR